MKNICCFTGHRNIPSDKYDTILNQTKTEIEKLIKSGVKIFVCGGAIGFDLLCGELVTEFKKIYDIKLIMAIPCRNQDKYYNNADKIRYNSLIADANKVVYVSEEYFNGCMHKRNRYMVDLSEYIIVYCTKNNGGSYYTKEYAKLKGLKIITIT